MLNKGLRLRRLVLACVLVGRFLFLYVVALFCGLFVVDLYFSGDLLLFSVFGGDWVEVVGMRTQMRNSFFYLRSNAKKSGGI